MVKSIQEAIKRIYDERAQRREDVTAKIQAVRQITENAIVHTPIDGSSCDPVMHFDPA
jgi:hypothetical protein